MFLSLKFPYLKECVFSTATRAGMLPILFIGASLARALQCLAHIGHSSHICGMELRMNKEQSQVCKKADKLTENTHWSFKKIKLRNVLDKIKENMYPIYSGHPFLH